MPLIGTYAKDGIFFNGEEQHEDGTVTVQQEIPIPFVRNRFCNPLGRLLGPKGQTVRWIRAETKCDIVLHTNNIRFLRSNAKATVKTRADRATARSRVDYALQLIRSIIDESNPATVHMSDYQLFHPEDEDNSSLRWIPSAFTPRNSGPAATEKPDRNAVFRPPVGYRQMRSIQTMTWPAWTPGWYQQAPQVVKCPCQLQFFAHNWNCQYGFGTQGRNYF